MAITDWEKAPEYEITAVGACSLTNIFMILAFCSGRRIELQESAKSMIEREADLARPRTFVFVEKFYKKRPPFVYITKEEAWAALESGLKTQIEEAGKLLEGSAGAYDEKAKS